MYSHYMDGSFSPLSHHHISSDSHESQPNNAGRRTQSKEPDKLKDVTGSLSKIIGGIWNQLSVTNIDLGDILLILIILLVLLEGDNLELVITLGLMLLLGFND